MPEAPRPAGGSPAPAEHELLTRLGKYVIERKLGSGGMGTVFLAQDSDLKRTVALKVLAKDRAENPVLVRRFKAEGQAAAYLQHKNIVGVYDSGQIDGFLYIALEYVDGQDVLEIIRKRGVIPSDGRSKSSGRSPKRWPTRRKNRSSIATSSRPTCSSKTTAR